MSHAPTSPNGGEGITATMARVAAGLRYEDLSCAATREAERRESKDATWGVGDLGTTRSLMALCEGDLR